MVFWWRSVIRASVEKLLLYLLARDSVSANHLPEEVIPGIATSVIQGR
jgi:hypothetical protein